MDNRITQAMLTGNAFGNNIYWFLSMQAAQRSFFHVNIQFQFYLTEYLLRERDLDVEYSCPQSNFELQSWLSLVTTAYHITVQQ